MTWREVWHADDFALAVERSEVEVAGASGVPGAAVRTLHRVVAGDGRPGAVAVCLRADQVLLVEVVRRAVGRTLLELPRGFGDLQDSSGEVTARRELLEETGLRAASSQPLGEVYADSGLLANAVAVVAVTVGDDAEPGDGDGEVADAVWTPISAVDGLVREGRIADGITLAALGLARAHGLLDRHPHQ